MALIEIRDFSFTYASENERLLKNISLTVEEGEIILLCGPTGCGKTTLLKQLKNEIAPIGKRVGAIFFENQHIEAASPLKTAKEIGMVFQDPENQIVTSTVWHELAFSLENFNFPTNEIRKKVAEMAAFFGIEEWLNVSVHTLSGGQKQLVNLAAILLLQPRLLLLDEPTAQLDPIAAREFLQMIHRVNQEFNTTIMIVEHRLEEVFPIVDRVILLENGEIKFADTPQKVIRKINQGDEYFHYLPEITKLFLVINKATNNSDNPVPITVREGKKYLSSLVASFQREMETSNQKVRATGETILECKDIFFQYDQGEKRVLESVSYSLPKGSFSAIIGGNGAGKSTLLRILTGLVSPIRGHVLLQEKRLKKIKNEELYRMIGYLPQNPLALFTENTVKEELNKAAQVVLEEGSKQRMNESIAFFGLEKLLHKHPYDLSGGERQKLALLCILLKQPKVLLIDEPTKGLDPKCKLEIGELLKQLQESGVTVLMVTHDIEFAAKYANHCSFLFNGMIVAEGTAKEMFSDNYFYTTAINRLVRNYIPQALNYEDVLEKWVGEGC